MPNYSPVGGFWPGGAQGKLRPGARPQYQPPTTFLNEAGNWAGSSEGVLDPSTTNLGQRPGDKVTFDSNLGQYINMRTRLPWTGPSPDGRYFQQGRPGTPPAATAAINPNDPAQRYKAIDIPKDPEISAAANDLLKSFSQTSKDSLGHFNDLLNEFKDNTSKAFKLSADATAGATDAEAALRGRQTQYDTALTGAGADYQKLNADDAAAQRDLVARGNALLPEYDRAAQNIGDRQVQELQKMISRYKLGTGTPTSLGSDESKILAQGLQDVLLPLEQAKIGRRYDLLANEAAVGRDITGRETNRIAQFNPATAGAMFQSGQGTELAIQGLRERIANMSMQDAIRFMQASAVPIEIMQRVLGNNITQLGAIGQLRDQSRYRGLQDLLGVNVSEPTGYNFNPGGVPSYGGGSSRYSGITAPNVPVTVGGGGTATGTSSGIGGAAYANYTPVRAVDGTLLTMNPPGRYGPILTGNVDLPNDYRWGRNAAAQAEFERQQARYS